MAGTEELDEMAKEIRKIIDDNRKFLDRIMDAHGADLPLRPQGPLDAREQTLARTAWSYLERNTDPVTGLADARE